MQTRRSTGLNVGGSSILVIFVLLCLTTFATLSMVSANAGYNLTVKNAEASRDFYEADARAETVLMQIDEGLRRAGQLAGDEEMFYTQTVPQFAGSFANPDLVYLPYASEGLGFDSGEIRFQVEIDRTQALSVAVQVHAPVADVERLYTITEWKVVSTAPLADFDDEPLNLWQGEL